MYSPSILDPVSPVQFGPCFFKRKIPKVNKVRNKLRCVIFLEIPHLYPPCKRIAPEKRWLEYFLVSFWGGLISGANLLLISGRVIPKSAREGISCLWPAPYTTPTYSFVVCNIQKKP